MIDKRLINDLKNTIKIFKIMKDKFKIFNETSKKMKSLIALSNANSLGFGVLFFD